MFFLGYWNPKTAYGDKKLFSHVPRRKQVSTTQQTHTPYTHEYDVFHALCYGLQKLKKINRINLRNKVKNFIHFKDIDIKNIAKLSIYCLNNFHKKKIALFPTITMHRTMSYNEWRGFKIMLLNIGEPSIPLLQNLLFDERNRDHWLAAETLFKMRPKSTPSLLWGLQHHDEKKRRRALLPYLREYSCNKTLSAQERNVLARLAIHDTSPKIRRDSIRIFACSNNLYIESPFVLSLCKKAYQDQHEDIRAHATWCLGRIFGFIQWIQNIIPTYVLSSVQNTITVPTKELIAGLQDTLTVRYATIYSLGIMGNTAIFAIPQLRSLLKQGSCKEKWFTLQTLINMGEEAASLALPELKSYLKNPCRPKGYREYFYLDYSLHGRLSQLGFISTFLLAASASSSFYHNVYRKLCLDHLQDFGEDAAHTIHTIISLLNQKDLAAKAAENLGLLGPIGEIAIPKLSTMLPQAAQLYLREEQTGKTSYAQLPEFPYPIKKIRDYTTQPLFEAILKSLVIQKKYAALAIPMLIKLLHHRDKKIWRPVSSVLSQIGLPVIPVVTPLLRSKNWFKRYRALNALPCVKAIIPSLLIVLEDKKSFSKYHSLARSQAVSCLTEIEPHSQITPFLIKYTNDTDKQVRYQAAKGLLSINKKLPHLYHMIQNDLCHSSSSMDASNYLDLLDHVHSRKKSIILIKLLQNSQCSWFSKIHSAWFLSDSEPRSVWLPTFKHALDSQHHEVRHATINKLMSLGTKARPLLPKLKTLISQWPNPEKKELIKLINVLSQP